jgi:hypothetical protein
LPLEDALYATIARADRQAGQGTRDRACAAGLVSLAAVLRTMCMRLQATRTKLSSLISKKLKDDVLTWIASADERTRHHWETLTGVP